MLIQRPGIRWAALLLLLTALCFWKLGFSNQFTFLDSPDMTGQVVPWYEVQAKAWKDGTFPLWDPYVWAGQPLLGQMQPGSAFPLNWPLFAAPLGTDGHIRYRFIHIQRVLIHLLAALFAFALARELEFSHIAAVLMGLAFTCGGWVGSVVWPQMLNGAIWLPLTLMLFHRAARQPTMLSALPYAVLCGGSVGLSLLSGHHQAPFFSLLALGGVFLYLLVERCKQDRSQAISLSVIFGVVGLVSFLVAGLQLLPAFEYGNDALRWVGAVNPVGRGDKVPYYVHHTLRLELVTLLGLVTPRLNHIMNTYVGWTALALALYAVTACWKERWVKVYALLTILSLSYASGTYSLLQGLAYALIPEAHTARTSAYAFFVTQLAIFVLAARGLDRLMQQSSAELQASTWIRRGQILLVSFAAMAYVTLFARAMWGQMDPNPADNVIFSALIALILAACLQGYKKGELTAKVFGGAMIVLVLSEAYSTQFYDISHFDDPMRRAHLNQLEEEFKGPMEFLTAEAARSERFRFSTNPELGGINIGARYGLEQTNGFLASVSQDIFELFLLSNVDEFEDLTNTKYYVSREPRNDIQIERYVAANGLRVFENPNAGPRSWVVYNTELITNEEFGTKGVPPVQPCESEGSVEETTWNMQTTALRVQSACPGYVVLADAFFHGWRVSVNGQDAPVLRYRKGLRAVYAPAGESAVEFRYEPGSVTTGAWMSGFGFLLCFLSGGWMLFGSRVRG